MIELLKLPEILGMFPLILFIVLTLIGKPQIAVLFLATALAMILSGTGIGSYSDLLAQSMGSDLALIGLVILMSSALGKVLELTGVSQTIVSGVVRKIGVKTEKSAIITTIICSTLVCGTLGTLSGGNSIIAPIIIPVVAAAGLSKSTVGTIFHNAGEVGLILGPLSPAVVALMSITGLSYGRMMLTAALPYGVIWIITAYFAAKKVQNKTRSTNPYTEINYDETFVPTKKHKNQVLVFSVCFVAFIAYAIIHRLGIAYLAFVMLAMTIIMGMVSGYKTDDIFKTAISGMASALPLFLLFLLFSPLFEMMTKMGAFKALSDVFSNLITVSGTGPLSKALVMIVATLIGSFGIEGAAVVQMQITHELFLPVLNMVSMPMELWAVALIAAARILVYPTANMIGQMGIARSDDMKSMLKVGWTVAVATMVFIVIYSFIGVKFLF